MKKLLLLMLLLAPVLAAPAVRVRLPGGWVEGSLEGGALSFKGIPYAHAERWRRPQLVSSWPGVLKAQRYGPICPQRGDITVRLGRLLGQYVPDYSEDCLNLNVWTPQTSPPAGGWPVMVFIHGGSFTGGSGSEPIYDGAALARRGVVVVTINYRLGALGFLGLPGLAAEDPNGSTGNYGLLDQLAALEWVRRQIAGFGGDPQSVTVFGESAGAMSVCDLLTSPLAAGAFDRAIMESGGCNYVLTKEEAEARANELAREAGCAVDDLECWRALPVEKLISLGSNAKADFEEGPFKPMVDGYVLPRLPEESLREGRVNAVPLLVGANANEYQLDATAQIDPRKFTWNGLVEIMRRKEGERAERVIAHYRRRFPHDAKLAYYNYMTERVLLCPSYRAGHALAGRVKTPVYGYLMQYVSPHWFMLGSMHGIELPFVFGTRDVWPFWTLFVTEPELQRTDPLQSAVQQAWTSFAAGTAPRMGFATAPRLGSGWLLGIDLRWGWRRDVWRERCALWGADEYQ